MRVTSHGRATCYFSLDILYRTPRGPRAGVAAPGLAVCLVSRDTEAKVNTHWTHTPTLTHAHTPCAHTMHTPCSLYFHCALAPFVSCYVHKHCKALPARHSWSARCRVPARAACLVFFYALKLCLRYALRSKYNVKCKCILLFLHMPRALRRFLLSNYQ